MIPFAGFFRQFEELDRLSKPLRDMEAEALLRLEALSKPLRDIQAAMKVAFDSTPIHEAIRRLDIHEQFKAAMKATYDLAPIQEAIRRMEELTTAISIDPLEFPTLPARLLPANFANRMPEPREPESKPKRPIGFIDTNDL
jgi:hypothetical protein